MLPICSSDPVELTVPEIVTSVNQGRDTYCTVLEYAGDTASVIVERLSFPAVACDGTDVVAVYNTS